MNNSFLIEGDYAFIVIKNKVGEVIGHTKIDTFNLIRAEELWGTWHMHSAGYVVGNKNGGGRRDRSKVYLHRWLTKAATGLVVDHIDGDKLNNTIKNLRVCTGSENLQNLKGASKRSRSGFLGVTWNKKENRWYAEGRYQGKKKYLGSYKNIEDAVEAVKEFRAQNLPFSREAMEREGLA